jgi:hypothetical protein
MEKNNTIPCIDILAKDNKYNITKNISIKTFKKGSSICCADICSFFERPDIDNIYNETTKIIIAEYIQLNNIKKIINIYEMNYDLDLRNKLFGSITYKNIKDYNIKIKKISRKMSATEALLQFDYKLEKKKLQDKNKMLITINPKISKTNKRVQCSISNKIFKILLNEKYIKKNEGIKVENIKIPYEYESSLRQRNNILTVYRLKKFCRINNIKKYSNKNKSNLIKFIINNNININSIEELKRII